MIAVRASILCFFMSVFVLFYWFSPASSWPWHTNAIGFPGSHHQIAREAQSVEWGIDPHRDQEFPRGLCLKVRNEQDERRVPAAKEVGMGNPTEETTGHPTRQFSKTSSRSSIVFFPPVLRDSLELRIAIDGCITACCNPPKRK